MTPTTLTDHPKTTMTTPAPPPGTRGAELRLAGLAKHYPGVDKPAVADVSLAVPAGELLALLGPSGCGKTTTLQMISGLVEPTRGQILVGGQDITALPVYRRGMGMVFQSYALFPHMTVGRNVAYGLTTRKVPRLERAEQVRDALAMVGLDGYADRRPRELSGGQQQRVALARALVVHPSLLLLDEPLSNLDAKLRDEMRDEIRSLQQRLGITTVFVTHDQDEALATADKVAVLHEGRVQQLGRPEDLYERPANGFVARFIGRANLFDGQVMSRDGDTLVVDVPGLGTMRAGRGRCDDTSTSVVVMVRPHRIGIASPGGVRPGCARFSGAVADRTYTGDTVHVDVRVNERVLKMDVATDGSTHHRVGDPLDIEIASGAAVALPAE
jgi:putative spermidine/putrescine transport system ATP-binding protein